MADLDDGGGEKGGSFVDGFGGTITGVEGLEVGGDVCGYGVGGHCNRRLASSDWACRRRGLNVPMRSS